MYYVGIDSGSTTTKGVLFHEETLVRTLLIKTTHRPKESIKKVYEELVAGLDLSDVSVVTTGYGRALLEESHKKVTEITCHAKGAAYLGSQLGARVRTVIDVGGQDSKVIYLDENSNVTEFLMNDKCAAGTGRFVEVILKLLKQDLETMDDYVRGSFPMKISSMCTVFAESEVIGLLSENAGGGSIALGVLHSIGERTANFAKRGPVGEDLFFSGGLSMSQSMRSILEEYLGLKVWHHPLSQYAGAIGAALIRKR